MIRRCAVRLFVAVTILAAAAAAIAVPGSRRQSPEPVLANATAPLAHSNSRDGRAILMAANLRAGEQRSGEVTITNEGHRGALYLLAHAPVDTPSAAGRRLSERLALDISDSSGRVWAAGALPTAATCYPLGVFGPGESRTYSFTVELAPGADNSYAGGATRVDYEWLESAVARDACPDQPLVAADDQVTVTLGDMQVAIEPGPYRFSRRGGTAKVGIRCIASDTRMCKGRLELERWKGGQGKGIAMALGSFAVKAGKRKAVTLKVNRRARKRIRTTGMVAVRAYVTAKDARGKRHRVAYRDRLLYRTGRKNKR